MFCRSGQRWTCSPRWGAVQFAVRARNDFGCSSGKYSTLWKSPNTGHLLEVTTEQEESGNFWRLETTGGGRFFCRSARLGTRAAVLVELARVQVIDSAHSQRALPRGIPQGCRSYQDDPKASCRSSSSSLYRPLSLRFDWRELRSEGKDGARRSRHGRVRALFQLSVLDD